MKVFAYFLILVLWLLTVTNLDYKMARTKGLHFLLLLNITSCLQNLLNIRKTVTAVVTDFLEASIPAAEAMLTAFQELEKRR